MKPSSPRRASRFRRPALAQTSITHRFAPAARLPTVPRIAALRDDALDNDHYAWDIVEGLTTEVGQRLAGDRGRGPRPRLGGGQAQGAGLRQRPCRAVRHAGVDARARRAPRSSRPSRRSWRSPRSATAARPARTGITGEIVGFDSLDALRWPRPTARSGARSSSSTITCSRPRTAPATASSARRAARARRIAIRKGALGDRRPLDRHRPSPQPPRRRPIFHRRRAPIPAGALAVPDAEQLSASSSAASR